MDRRLIQNVENSYPYPIASEFRILNTEEYLETDEKRLIQILKTAEITIHLLSLISLVDLLENHSKTPVELPEAFIKEFPARFTRTSFGKWIALIRENIKIFKANDIQMFIKELPDYFVKGKSSESEAQKAFNRLTSIRNKLVHPDFSPTKETIHQFCEESEELLETILTELDFIIDYPFLFVNNVTVKYHKWYDPKYNHAFSEVIGNTSKFRAYKKMLKGLVNTPAVIITKEKEEDYLNLDPVVIYSEEGEKRIPDIFLYTDWDKKKTVKYKPVWNGGAFNLIGTVYETENINSLLKFFEFFAEESIFQGYKESVDKLNSTANITSQQNQ